MRREEPDRAVTVGADKAYDTAEFVRTCKAFGAEAHVARNTSGRRSNIGEEMAASEGYQASQVHRKRDRAGLRLGEDGGASLEDPASRTGASGLAVHSGVGGLLPDPPAEAVEGRSMTAGARCRATVGAPSSRCRGRQSFPSAGPHRCAEIRRLVPSEQIDPTDTFTPKVAHKNHDLTRSSAAC